MALGDPSSPVRFGQGQDGADTRHLWLDVFGGEIMEAFDSNTLFLDKHTVKTVAGGMRSARFPKTWKATSEYHTPGQELLGTDIETTEVSVTVDDILVSHTALSDLDQMLSHFDARGPFSRAMGHELAKVFDRNVARQLILAARDPADGPFPGGTVITDAALVNSSPTATTGAAWIEHIREANIAFYDQKDVPEYLPRYCAVNATVFDAIKYAKDTDGNYLILNRDFRSDDAGGISKRDEMIEIDGVMVYRTKHLPSTDESADVSIYSKYRSNYSTTTGVMWCPDAIATVKVMDIGFETERDTRRLEDFMVAKMLVGHGALRKECSLEFQTAAPTP